jgi:hypothetical protein
MRNARRAAILIVTAAAFVAPSSALAGAVSIPTVKPISGPVGTPPKLPKPSIIGATTALAPQFTNLGTSFAPNTTALATVGINGNSQGAVIATQFTNLGKSL